MDAAGGALGIRAIRSPQFARWPWRVIACQSLAGIVATAAILLAVRRSVGALLAPLSAVALGMVATSFCAAAIGAMYFQRRPGAEIRASTCFVLPWVLAVSLLVIAISLSLPGSSAVGIGVMWLAIIGAEFVLWKPPFPFRSQASSIALPKLTALPHHQAPSSPEQPLVDLEVGASDALQTLRYRRIDGALVVEGRLWVDFAPGQRIATAHVAFCPAFVRPPAVEAETEDGPECEIRPSLVIPWGVKWEVKLDEAAVERISVALAFQAIEDAAVIAPQ